MCEDYLQKFINDEDIKNETSEIYQRLSSLLIEKKIPIKKNLVPVTSFVIAASFPGDLFTIWRDAFGVLSIWGWVLDDYIDNFEINIKERSDLLKKYVGAIKSFTFLTVDLDKDFLYADLLFPSLIKLNKKLNFDQNEKEWIKEYLLNLIENNYREICTNYSDYHSFEEYLLNALHTIYTPFYLLLMFLYLRSDTIDNNIKEKINRILFHIGKQQRLLNDTATYRKELPSFEHNGVLYLIHKGCGELEAMNKCKSEISNIQSNLENELGLLKNNDTFKLYLRRFLDVYKAMYSKKSVREFNLDFLIHTE